MLNRMPKDRLARLAARLTLPRGFEAYQASGEALLVHAETDTHQGTEGVCRVCLKKCFGGDRAIRVLTRRAGSRFAGRTVELVHEDCEAVGNLDGTSGGRNQ